MQSFVDWLFGVHGFMSHGNCYLWNPPLVALHVVADSAIGAAYAAISLTLLRLVRRARGDMPFRWIFLAFGAFIIACGCTHFMEVWTIWTPLYWLSGIIKAITAVASVATALMLPRLVPEALTLIRNARLSDERRLGLARLNAELEERVRARTAELEAANDQLAEKAAIVSNSSDAIFTKNLDRIIAGWNPAAERIYGYSTDEIVGQNVGILVPADRRAELDLAMARLARGEVVGAFETVRLRKDGTPIDVHLSISPLFDAQGRVRGASVIARDITEQKRAERQLRETQKLESLGVIAGGIAHDFNNLLVGILGNASLVLESLPPAHPHRNLLNRVVSASEKAGHLTRQLLAYAGKGRFLAEPIDFSALIREMSDLLRTSLPRSVELRLQLEEDLPTVIGDPSQFQQLVMNLAINGAEAIGEDRVGTLTLAVYRRRVDGPPQIAIEVRDTGSGMDDETKAKIFDPFFTTKFTGRGLGLAAAQGIVRGHRGTIQVESAPGRGSVFSVLLPAGPGKPAPPAETGPLDLKGSGLVLVIDDEEFVRSVSKAALEHFGYTVVTADGGEAGVESFRRRAGEVSAVLLDLTMPVMSGEEAFRRIREIRPDAKVILSSGHDRAEAARRFPVEGIAGFIQKPYTAVSVAKILKTVLAG
jgi:PAS domain S-box-containing protein